MRNHSPASRLRATISVAAAIATLLTPLGMVHAQESGSGSNLTDLPDNLSVLGPSDPHVYKATAIVNGKVITNTEVEQRLALIVLANGRKVEDKELAALRLQVLRNLIDESLQIQEAKANDIVIPKAEIEQSFARVAANFKQDPAGFAQYLRSHGSSAASVKGQIEGELAWSRLLRTKVQPFINVSRDEVQGVINRLNAAKGTEEYRLGEIYLSATPENAAQIAANARNIMEQVQKGGSFTAYARQFSEASTASVGGDLGWVRPAQLPDELAQAAQKLGVGQMAGPVQVSGGFSIIVLVDKRQVLTADPRDAVLSLKQLSIPFPPGTSKADAAAKIRTFTTVMQRTNGCGAANEAGRELGAEVVDNDNVKLRDLPGPLQEMLMGLQVGQATPAFGSIESGVRALIVCGRDDSQVAGAPSFDQIMSQLEDDRVNKRARIYLRDLRRDAVIEYN